MALSERLDVYLRLERVMLELDDREDPLADHVRDLMDPLWYELSAEEHEFLDARKAIDVRVLYPITLSVPDLYRIPSETQAPLVEVVPEAGVGLRFSPEGVLWAA